MRLDEHGRWVSDDGAYVWDENAQTWQPTTRPAPTTDQQRRAGRDTAAAPGTAGAGAASAGTGTPNRGGEAGGYPLGAYGTGQRPAATGASVPTTEATGGYGRRSADQQGYAEPRTGSFPLFGADARGGRDRDTSWSPATGPYPQGPLGRADPLSGAHPLNTGTRDGGTRDSGASRLTGPARTGPAGTGSTGTGSTGTSPAASGTGQSRTWSARDPLGTGPYDRADPLGTGASTPAGYDREDPLSGPFHRADPLGTTSNTGSWTRAGSGTGPVQGRAGSGTGPNQGRGGTGPTAARPEDPETGPGTAAVNLPTSPSWQGDRADYTDPAGPRAGAGLGGSGRFSAAAFGKLGTGASSRADRLGDTRDRDLDDPDRDDPDLDDPDLDDPDLDDPDLDDEDLDDADLGLRGRGDGLNGRLGAKNRDLDDDDPDDEDLNDADDQGHGRLALAVGGLVDKVRASRGRMLAVAAAALVLVVVAVVLVLKITSGGGSSGPAAGGTPASGRQYDANIRKAYLDVCLQNKGKQAYCTCTLQKLEAGYSQQDFLRINADPTSTMATRVVKETFAACQSLR